jgi:hypothetical protein
LFLKIVGPMAYNPKEMFGSYAPTFDPKFTSTPLSSLSSMATSTNYASGCGAEGNRCVHYNTTEIMHAVGLGGMCEEGGQVGIGDCEER